jgi:hypothetical protein
MKKDLILVVVSVLVSVGLSALVLGGGSVPSELGGRVHNVMEDFSEGISVDGTTVLDGSGNIDAPVTSTTGIFSSYVVGGASVASGSFVGQFTNGTATTSLLFSGDSTTKGTCIKLRNTAGVWTYIRVFGTTITANTTKCY